MNPIPIAIVGLGKIARDQHLPAIAANPAFRLTATVNPDGDGVNNAPHFTSLDALLANGPAVEAVALCTPPQVRYDIAARALARGLHVFLEKPPSATLAEVAALEATATDARVTLFAGWHSRFAAGVAPAKAWLAGRRIDRVEIVWREDVRVWHPGQAWIWQPGGLGVFDPGINALSIATHILPHPLFLKDAMLDLPVNRAAPIGARMTLSDPAGTLITMDLDWRQTGPQTWDITVETDAGTCRLSSGGAVLSLPAGVEQGQDHEYPGLYTRFEGLIRGGRSDVDTTPLQLVADAFLIGHRQTVKPFDD